MNNDRVAREAIEWVANPKHVIGWKNIYTMQCIACRATADAVAEQEIKHAPDCLHLQAKALLASADGAGEG